MGKNKCRASIAVLGEVRGHSFVLDVQVEESMFQAVIHFSDPSYRCFIFGKYDLTPTVEEYRDLLMIKDSNPDKIYWPRTVRL